MACALYCTLQARAILQDARACIHVVSSFVILVARVDGVVAGREGQHLACERGGTMSLSFIVMMMTLWVGALTRTLLRPWITSVAREVTVATAGVVATRSYTGFCFVQWHTIIIQADADKMLASHTR